MNKTLIVFLLAFGCSACGDDSGTSYVQDKCVYVESEYGTDEMGEDSEETAVRAIQLQRVLRKKGIRSTIIIDACNSDITVNGSYN